VSSDAEHPTEESASWTELFFDLVVVAGVLQLSHLLHEGRRGEDLGLFTLLYLALWITWAGFTVYGTDASRRGVTPTLLFAMAGLAVMVSAVPAIGAHAPAFIIAYVLLRGLTGRLWGHGHVMVDWPLAHIGGGILPWIISLWEPAPARYWLWAAGITFDLVILLTTSGSRILTQAQARVEHMVHLPGHPERAQRRVPVVQAAYPDTAHLAERLGLFVIIVLGEGVIQITSAAGGTPWNLSLAGTAAGAFALLVALWAGSLLHGAGGVPQPGPDQLPVRLTLTLHCVMTCSLAALAAGLGLAIEHPHHAAPYNVRWLLCLALALYFAVAVLAAVVSKASRWPTLVWALPCLAATLLLALFAGHFASVYLVWALTAAACWLIGCLQYAAIRQEKPAQP
jgi:low temperature requirement protein LtrA